MNLRLNISTLPFYLIFIILWSATVRYPFFWDTVQLASKHAHFFYETGFHSIILPNEIDSGHIPTLGIYLALIWKITGKSLIISHLAMLPFVMGIVYQSLLLVRRFFSSDWYYYALLIILLDATLLAQCTLVSSDVMVMFFFLMALNNLLSGKRSWYSLALAGLTLSSMRGMMCVAGLFLSEAGITLFMNRPEFRPLSIKKIFDELVRILKPSLPSIIIALCFFAWHYYKTGWIGYHKNMPWYPLFEPAGIKGSIRNIFILGWRLIDFGRLFIWLTGAYCLWHYNRERPELPAFFKKILIILISVFLTLSYTFILHKGLTGHRYILPVYILFAILVTYYLFEVTNSGIIKKAFFYIMLAGILSGNFWIYPDNIAKGWDSTLAYLPYFPLRDKMMNWMEKEDIPLSLTGTYFPNYGRLEYIDLSGKDDSFAEFNLDTNRFVFYSNVFNEFSDKELYDLKTRWKKLKEYRFLMVKIILYGAPDPPEK